jgi:hypothetical protein
VKYLSEIDSKFGESSNWELNKNKSRDAKHELKAKVSRQMRIESGVTALDPITWFILSTIVKAVVTRILEWMSQSSEFASAMRSMPTPE